MLDDLQWADELSIGFLSSLSPDFLAQNRVVIIATYRNDEIDAPLSDLLQASAGKRVALGRLDRSAVGEMIQDMLALRSAPKTLLDFLFRASRGNPFFVAEFLRVTVKEGLVERNRGRWKLSSSVSRSIRRSLEKLPLSDTLKELMNRHLLRLDPSARRVLSAASVFGMDVNVDLLSVVCGGSVLEPLAHLRDEQLVEGTVPGHVRFTHAQLRDFAYSQLDGPSKTRLHERVVRALERMSQSDSQKASLYPVLAHHWAAACRPLRAGVYFVRSAEHAQVQHAQQDAIRFYESANDVIGTGERVDTNKGRLSRGVHERLGDVLVTAGALPRALEIYARATNIGPETDSLANARLLRKLAKAHVARHQHADAIRLFDVAAQTLNVPDIENESSERFKEWVELELGRAWAYYWTKNSEQLDLLLPTLGRLVKARGTAAQHARYHEAVCFAELRRDRYAVSRASLAVIRKAAKWAGTLTTSRESASIRFAFWFCTCTSRLSCRSV